jgi:hypothetical protein
MFTTVMILQLVEEGKLKLTDTLDTFFPQVPNAKNITIGQILAHRSGIPNVRRDQNSQGNVNTTPITKDEMLALIAKATPDFEPDSKQSYSNSGYFLLGLILEKLTANPTGKPSRKESPQRSGSRIHTPRREASMWTKTKVLPIAENTGSSYVHFSKTHRSTYPTLSDLLPLHHRRA